MRLKPEKIERLAELVFAALQARPEVELVETPDHIKGMIRRVITEDLKAEDEIEEEARRVLAPHMDQIQRKGASFDKMLLKAKQRLAQERKMVL